MNYNVIKSESVYEETEKRSKFISYSFKVKTATEAAQKLQEIKLLHHAAKHHVYGYILEESEKFSDDGEPCGTGGAPIMTAIKSFNLKNVMVIVVRYVGGVLLGTGGLRRMYSSGAMNVLEKSGVLKMEKCSEGILNCNYNQIGMVSNAILNFDGKILETNYSGEVSIKFYVKNEFFNALKIKLENILRSSDKVNFICESYHETQ
mgnify:FL=1